MNAVSPEDEAAIEATKAPLMEHLVELRRRPIDVIVLDIEMPVMDGLTALPLLLKARPGLQIVMASTLTERGADVSMRALRLGAADYVPKPSAMMTTFRLLGTLTLTSVRVGSTGI